MISFTSYLALGGKDLGSGKYGLMRCLGLTSNSKFTAAKMEYHIEGVLRSERVLLCDPMQEGVPLRKILQSIRAPTPKRKDINTDKKPPQHYIYTCAKL